MVYSDQHCPQDMDTAVILRIHIRIIHHTVIHIIRHTGIMARTNIEKRMATSLMVSMRFFNLLFDDILDCLSLLVLRQPQGHLLQSVQKVLHQTYRLPCSLNDHQSEL